VVDRAIVILPSAFQVTVTHDCINQLRLSLMGPGAQSGSPNFHSPSASYEVGLLNQPRTVQATCVSGTHTFVFDDDAFIDGKDCCRPDSVTNTYRPDGKLGEFVGASPSGVWTLVVEDKRSDIYVGSIDSWEINFQLTPCIPRYIWTNLTGIETGSKPPPLYQCRSVVYNTSLFVFGGRDKYDVSSKLLYRFDTTNYRWTQLTPVNFDVAVDFSSSVGANLMLTPYGLLRYGGLKRQSDINGQYTNDVFIQDFVTQRWRRVDVLPTPFPVSSRQHSPAGRYLSGGLYISSKEIHWRTIYSYRILYDQQLPSMHANFANSQADSILLFGGFDGSTGSVFDGSSGGLLNDAWMIRLSNFSVQRGRFGADEYRRSNCAWRHASSTTTTCLGSLNANCVLRDLLLLAWCGEYYQNV
jgi:hypothetical protein